jgi:hypothetical protein
MNPAEVAAAQATAATIAANKTGQKRRKMVMGINVGPYAGFRVPGIDRTAIFSQPSQMLKNPNPNSSYCWRKPDDAYTISMVNRGVLAPVKSSEVDMNSRFANIEIRKVLTKDGPQSVVRTPGGLGLYEIRNQEQMNNADLGDLPGEQWERAYLSELAGSEDKFAEDLETVNHESLGARVSGSMTTKETARETII